MYRTYDWLGVVGCHGYTYLFPVPVAGTLATGFFAAFGVAVARVSVWPG